MERKRVRMDKDDATPMPSAFSELPCVDRDSGVACFDYAGHMDDLDECLRRFLLPDAHFADLYVRGRCGDTSVVYGLRSIDVLAGSALPATFHIEQFPASLRTLARWRALCPENKLLRHTAFISGGDEMFVAIPHRPCPERITSGLRVCVHMMMQTFGERFSAIASRSVLPRYTNAGLPVHPSLAAFLKCAARADSSPALAALAAHVFFAAHRSVARNVPSRVEVEASAQLARHRIGGALMRLGAANDAVSVDISANATVSSSSTAGARRVVVVDEGGLSDGARGAVLQSLREVLGVGTEAAAEAAAEQQVIMATLPSHAGARPASFCDRVLAAVDADALAHDIFAPFVLLLHDSDVAATGIGCTVDIVGRFFDALISEHAFFVLDEDTDTLRVGGTASPCAACPDATACRFLADDAHVRRIGLLLAWLVVHGGSLSRPLHPALLRVLVQAADQTVTDDFSVVAVYVAHCNDEVRRRFITLARADSAYLAALEHEESGVAVTRRTRWRYMTEMCRAKMRRAIAPDTTRTCEFSAAFGEAHGLLDAIHSADDRACGTLGQLIAAPGLGANEDPLIVLLLASMLTMQLPDDAPSYTTEPRRSLFGFLGVYVVRQMRDTHADTYEEAAVIFETAGVKLCSHFDSYERLMRTEPQHAASLLKDATRCALETARATDGTGVYPWMASLEEKTASLAARVKFESDERCARALLALVAWFQHTATWPDAVRFYRCVTAARRVSVTSQLRDAAAEFRRLLAASVPSNIAELESVTDLVNLVNIVGEASRSATGSAGVWESDTSSYHLVIDERGSSKGGDAHCDWLPRFTTCARMCRLSGCTTQAIFNKNMRTALEFSDHFDDE